MNLNLKLYKLLKTKILIENNSLILLFNEIKSENTIFFKNYNCYFIRIKLLKKLLQNSKLCNLSNLTNGILIFVTLKKYNLDIKTFEKIKTNSLFMGLKLNNKLYSSKQLKKIKTLNYYLNIKNLHTSLNFNLMCTTLKIKKISK